MTPAPRPRMRSRSRSRDASGMTAAPLPCGGLTRSSFGPRLLHRFLNLIENFRREPGRLLLEPRLCERSWDGACGTNHAYFPRCESTGLHHVLGPGQALVDNIVHLPRRSCAHPGRVPQSWQDARHSPRVI